MWHFRAVRRVLLGVEESELQPRVFRGVEKGLAHHAPCHGAARRDRVVHVRVRRGQQRVALDNVQRDKAAALGDALAQKQRLTEGQPTAHRRARRRHVERVDGVHVV